MPEVNSIATQWFEKGKEDLQYAKVGLKEGLAFGLTCFHCQQAVEKYLKGYLTIVGHKFPKTHFLEELLRFAIEIEPKFEKFKEIAKKLDDYYIAPRYPIDFSKAYSKEEAQTAIKEAKKLLNL